MQETNLLNNSEEQKQAQSQEIIENGQILKKDPQEAEKLKNQGNEYFKNGKFNEALESYTKAIDICDDNKKLSIYYSNRAFCHIKLESYGLALQDSQSCIKNDTTYVKGYYREGSSYLLLSKLDQAKQSFQIAKKLSQGKDSDIVEKFKQVKKLIVEREFAKTIETDKNQQAALDLDYSKIEVESSYDGPQITENEQVTPDFCNKVMAYMKDQKKLHKKYLLIVLKKALDIFKMETTLVEFNYPDEIELTVCGDTHGQYYDLLNIFKINGNPSETNPYLFNGDFVDRGSFSLEVMLTLICWKVCYPNAMHLTRGNHETKNMNKLYGFEGEVIAKYNQQIFDIFSNLFCYLPLVYLLNKKVQVNHGGLFSKDGVTLKDIKNIDRVREPPEEGIMTDLLWSDPVKENGRHPSKRGVSVGFGPDVSKRYLTENNLELLVRSHEMKQDGYEVEADGKVITIFSAPNYCDQMGNKGAFIRFKGKDMIPKFTQFSHVEHPKLPPMAYSRSFYNLM